MRKWQTLTAVLFLTPCLLGLGIFTLWAMVYSLGLSFTKWDLITQPKFVGAGNYHALLVKDPVFWKAVGNTVLLTILFVPVSIAGALCVAMGLRSVKRGVRLLRALYFLPAVTPIVAFALVWDWLLSPNFGLFNYFLTRLGRQSIYFLGSETTALATVIFVTIWASVGYYSLVIAAGLARIPRELEEAALLDGARPLHRFIKIILPQLGPTLLFLCVIGVITSFQVFDSVFVMTHPRGGPNYATTTLVLHLYNMAFGGYDLKMGYACAIAWAIFACIFVSVWLQLQWSRRTVHYR